MKTGIQSAVINFQMWLMSQLDLSL